MNIGHFRFLVLLVVLSYLPAIGFYYVGEEAIFPISALEMWHQRDWLRQHLFGFNLYHNPLFNWLIIPFAALAGWEHMLQVARTITVTATLATGATVGWLAWRLLRDANVAWFAALTYLTLADVLLYRGWLAYVDPLFGFFVFAAIAALWVACEERRPNLLVLAVASLTCAFMSKAFTAYVFYGTAVLVLLMAPQRRRILLGPASLVLHVIALLAPALWLALMLGDPGQGIRMFDDILAKLTPKGVFEYLRQLAGFPAETVLRLSPAILLVAYFAWRRRIVVSTGVAPHLKIALWIAGLGYLPYWLSPHGAIRYLVPLYPLIGFALALLLWCAGEQAVGLTRRWLIGMVVVKFVAALALFPYYQSHYRGENYALAAQDAIARSAGQPLYTMADTASGLSIAGYIDAWRYPAAPLRWAPDRWESGFVLTETEDPALGKRAARYQLGGDEIFLLCRGAACTDGAR
jgi:4-amino-4-deoxy-L-arabinose transferase-like glycosyltransferase